MPKKEVRHTYFELAHFCHEFLHGFGLELLRPGEAEPPGLFLLTLKFFQFPADAAVLTLEVLHLGFLGRVGI